MDRENSAYMLAIRMQRLGRKSHPTFRVVVQDVRQTPTSGKYVAKLGSYDPHTKTNTLVKDKAQFYLDHGAQPSDRVVKLFTTEGIKIPKWVKEPTKQERTTRNPDKLRKNQPEKPKEEAPAEEPVAEVTEPSAEEAKVEETPVEEAKTEEIIAETPEEEVKTDEKVAEAETETGKPELKKEA